MSDRRLLTILRSPRVALIWIVVLAGALRFSTLATKSYWSDEGQTIADVRGSFGHLWKLLGSVENSPPLFFVLQWGWSHTFGLSEVGTRSLSALLGTATVALVYEIARRIPLSERVAIVAALLAAINPLLLWYSQEARSYALLIFLGALSLVFFLHARNSERTRYFVLWAAVCVLMFYTHYFAFPVVATEGAWLLWRQSTRLRAVGALAAIAVCTAPLLLTQSAKGDTQWVAHLSLVARLLLTPVTFIVGFDGPVAAYFILVAVVLVGVSLAILLRRGTAQERFGALVAASVATSAMVFPLATGLLGFDLFIYRYVLLAVVPVIIVIAAGLGAQRAGRLGAWSLAGFCVMSLVIFGLSASTPKYGTEDWRAVAAAVRQPSTGKLVLLFPTGGTDTLAASALSAYLQPVRLLSTRAPVSAREVDVVVVTQRDSGQGHAPRPRDPAHATALTRAGFRLVGVQRHPTYAVARYRSSTTRRVPAAALAAGAVLSGRRFALSYAPAGSAA